MTSESLPVSARDGLRLAATLYGGGDGPVVVVASAMGVPQRFYRPFARDLAAGGFRALTFDYRGIGASVVPQGEDYAVDVAAWGEDDLDGVLRFAREELGAPSLALVGHSVGGQLLPLADQAQHLDAAYLVASQSGHWRHWDGAWRWKMAASWYLMMPAVTAALGKLPSRLLGGGDDVPAGVARQWARWGRHRDYVLSHRDDVPERFSRLRFPLTMVQITDDEMAPPRAVDALASYYTGATTTRRVVDPREVGRGSIGHFGFFRQKHGQVLWPSVHAFFREHLAV